MVFGWGSARSKGMKPVYRKGASAINIVLGRVRRSAGLSATPPNHALYHLLPTPMFLSTWTTEV